MLPTLTVADIERSPERLPWLPLESVNGIALHRLPQPTNGVAYFKGVHAPRAGGVLSLPWR